MESHDLDNFTPLLIAANYGHTETISVLIRHKANVTAMDKHDKTVLYQCAEENRPDALKVSLFEHMLLVRLLKAFGCLHGKSLSVY